MTQHTSDGHHTLAWQAQSLLLAYPDENLAERLDLARRVAATRPRQVGEPLLTFVEHAERTDLHALATAYVATFDHRKRCCPYLTYYAHGDTRNRGVALLRLKQAYTAAGWRLGDDELPDHIAVLLEFAATTPRAGGELLGEHRAGLELLRLALRESASPWADVLDSVSATLPALEGDAHDAVRRLAAQGPPEEQVGLAPFIPLTSLGGRR
ncbi:nitrate reductase molybdenum cofactor assembly chaperone [Streptomyces sp. NPDC006422]|uniref:nitrate reductase molybdenum cofactor assembly chaperone n=1 Tax=unclassified Streptomyces TaxID=2593676 RepID=UPI0033A892FF